MTLQYRIRSKYDDELWRHRVSLCEAVLFQALDAWCVSGVEFPTREIVTDVLYVFSPRCDANALSTSNVSQRLKSIVESPETECRLAWPERSSDEAAAIVASLSSVVSRAVEIWKVHGVRALSASDVAHAFVREILAQRYVVMHHSETTKRDANHWGI
jgi:hypothetical protein